jgi:alpha-ketoglutarate-dependent taurine dioxygenase
MATYSTLRCYTLFNFGYLPGKQMSALKFKKSIINEEQLPLLVEPLQSDQANMDCLIQYLQENNQEIREQLIKHGAILFRGFNCLSTDLFSKAISACSLGENYKYELCDVPRTKITDQIYSSVNLPPHYNLELHNEKSHDPKYPTHVYFSCIQNAEQGGITPLADAHKVWNSLPGELQEKLKTKGILYKKFNYGNGVLGKILKLLLPGFEYLTWMAKYDSSDKKTVENRLNAMGYKLKWTRDDNLKAEYLLPACKIHPVTGKTVWFNQSNHLNAHNNIVKKVFSENIKNPIARFLFVRKKCSAMMAFFGDGEDFTKKESDIIIAAIDKNTVYVPWQPGDFLVIDNYSCMHGKTPHVGQRLILAGLTRFNYEN